MQSEYQSLHACNKSAIKALIGENKSLNRSWPYRGQNDFTAIYSNPNHIGNLSNKSGETTANEPQEKTTTIYNRDYFVKEEHNQQCVEETTASDQWGNHSNLQHTIHHEGQNNAQFDNSLRKSILCMNGRKKNIQRQAIGGVNAGSMRDQEEGCLTD